MPCAGTGTVTPLCLLFSSIIHTHSSVGSGGLERLLDVDTFCFTRFHALVRWGDGEGGGGVGVQPTLLEGGFWEGLI